MIVFEDLLTLEATLKNKVVAHAAVGSSFRLCKSPIASGFRFIVTFV